MKKIPTKNFTPAPSARRTSARLFTDKNLWIFVVMLVLAETAWFAGFVSLGLWLGGKL